MAHRPVERPPTTRFAVKGPPSLIPHPPVPCLSKIERFAGSEPRLGLGRAFGAALGAFAGRVHASVAALRPQPLRRPSGASPSLVQYDRSPHPPQGRRRRRTSCFVSFRRPHPQRTFSTLPVRPPHLPRMRPIGAGTPLFACSEKRSQLLNRKLKLFWTAMIQIIPQSQLGPRASGRLGGGFILGFFPLPCEMRFFFAPWRAGRVRAILGA